MHPPDVTPIVRHAARVLLVDPSDRLLLVRCIDPARPDQPFWLTPGGGLDPGETHEHAALREAREELGLSLPSLGPHVWTRRHTFRWGANWYDQREHFFFCRTDPFEIQRHGQTEEELMVLTHFHWWTAAELAEQAATLFAPRRIATLFVDLLRDGPPAQPIQIGA